MTQVYFSDKTGPLVKAIRSSPPLNREENNRLSRLVAAGGEAGQRAREQMVTGNMRLVLHIASRYMDGGMSLEDRIQEGVFGLMRAITKFDPDRGFGFSTYATFWIRAAIDRAVIGNENIIYVPANVALAHRRMKNEEARTGNKLTEAEAIDLMMIGVSSALAVLTLPTVIPADSSRTNGDDDSRVIDIVPGDDDGTDYSTLQADLWRAVETCPDISDRDRNILEMHAFGFSYEETGQKYGLSRERVRQVLAKVSDRVRRHMMQ